MSNDTTSRGNPQAIAAGVKRRDRIVTLVTKNVEKGGDGLTRAELAKALGIAKPSLVPHLTTLIEDGRIEQIGLKIVPASTGHIHICRTCGHTMKEAT